MLSKAQLIIIHHYLLLLERRCFQRRPQQGARGPFLRTLNESKEHTLLNDYLLEMKKNNSKIN